MRTPSLPTLPALTRGAASVTGGALAGATRVLAGARSARKPLHPVGDVVTGTLVRRGGDQSSGVGWLDSSGTDAVVVRFSRAIGLPRAMPDIHGLALRATVDGRSADLLLASTGLGQLTRFVLTASWGSHERPLTTLLPYQGPHGPLVLAARATTSDAPVGPGSDDTVFELMWAIGRGDWVPFAELTVSTTNGPDPAISFDPVENPLPGLAFYPWVRRLRAPAYRTARASSDR